MSGGGGGGLGGGCGGLVVLMMDMVLLLLLLLVVMVVLGCWSVGIGIVVGHLDEVSDGRAASQSLPPMSQRRKWGFVGPRKRMVGYHHGTPTTCCSDKRRWVWWERWRFGWMGNIKCWMLMQLNKRFINGCMTSMVVMHKMKGPRNASSPAAAATTGHHTMMVGMIRSSRVARGGRRMLMQMTYI